MVDGVGRIGGGGYGGTGGVVDGGPGIGEGLAKGVGGYC